MPISAVIDASVLVSAFLFPGSVPGLILRLAAQGRFSMHLSSILVEETRTAILSPRLKAAYRREEEAVYAWCNNLEDIGRIFTGSFPDVVGVCRDPNDDHVLAFAIALRADVIVTGDKDLLTLQQFQAVRILTPRAFLTELAPEKV